MVSEKCLKDMIASYRRAMPVEALSDSDIALIEQAEVRTDRPYELEDIPEIEDVSSPSR